MSSEHLTEIANLLDVFFKGLTECGVLISYSVKLQVYVEDLEIIKIKNLISQLIQNLQTLYVKIPYPETKETIIYNETTNVITDSKCNDVFLKENENFVVICNPVTFTTSVRSSNNEHVNAVGVMTTRVAEQAHKNNGSLYNQISNNESNHRISLTESSKVSDTENDFNGDKINLENNNKVTKSLNSININNLKCIIIPSIRNTNRLENQQSLLQTNSCHSENNNNSTQFNAVDNSQLNKKDDEIKSKNDNLPENDEVKDTGNLLQETSSCLLENKEQLGKEHVHDFTENVVHIIVETTDKPSNSIENENNQNRSESNKQENNSDFVCVECNEIFDELFKLEMHLQQHKPTCYVCLQEFTSLKDLNEHCQTSHKGAGCFSCTICNKIFVTSNGLKKHNSDSHCNNRNNYTCDICNKMFVTKLGLTRHIDSHHGKKTAVCDICGKSFRRSDYLQIHYKIHLGKRTFSCKLCPKKFLRHMQLKAHEKVHSGVKDHVCDICNKGFGRSDKLKEHMLRHLNIKRFQCKVCKKHYAENRDLKRHLKRHF